MGRRIGLALGEAVLYQEGHNTITTGIAALKYYDPRAVVYNWHPTTMPWAPEIARRFPATKHIALMHDITPATANAGSEHFQYRIVCYPEFPVDNQHLFGSVRHVPRYEKPRPSNERMTIGSFGFGVGGKLFDLIVGAVGDEFPGALLRLQIPYAHYGDDAGAIAKQQASRCVAMAQAKGLQVAVTHDFLEEEKLIDWLAGNDLNVFFYDGYPGRGLASTIDYAIAAQRPIAVNHHEDALRHVLSQMPSWPSTRLRALHEQTGPIVERLYQEWSPARLVQEYKDMFRTIGV